MPTITIRQDYNGFVTKVDRLGLGAIVAEVELTLNWQLLIEESRQVNGTQGIRKAIDQKFSDIGGWTKVASGGIDWSKSTQQGSRLGVEIQVSGRSDMLAVDIMHLSEKLQGGVIDAGIIVAPDDNLSRFLTDRTPNYRTAIRHVEHRAKDLPLRVLAFGHDGIGPALSKIRTNLGKSPES